MGSSGEQEKENMLEMEPVLVTKDRWSGPVQELLKCDGGREVGSNAEWKTNCSSGMETKTNLAVSCKVVAAKNALGNHVGITILV